MNEDKRNGPEAKAVIVGLPLSPFTVTSLATAVAPTAAAPRRITTSASSPLVTPLSPHSSSSHNSSILGAHVSSTVTPPNNPWSVTSSSVSSNSPASSYFNSPSSPPSSFSSFSSTLGSIDSFSFSQTPLSLSSPRDDAEAIDSTRDDILFDTTPNSFSCKIKASKLSTLIDNLTKVEHYDIDVVQSFIMTYRNFATPELILEILFQKFAKFQNNSYNSALPVHQRKKMFDDCFKILDFLTVWITKHSDDLDKENIFEIDMWLNTAPDKAPGKTESTPFSAPPLVSSDSTASVDKSEKAIPQLRKVLARSLCDLKTVVSNACVKMAPPPPDTSLYAPYVDLMEAVSPLQIAQQLCLMDYSIFSTIKCSEFLKSGWIKPDKDKRSPNIVAFTNRFNMLGEWAISMVLTKDKAKQQAMVIKHLANIASECLKLNNFFSSMAIFSGLNHTSIFKLTETWKSVPSAQIKQLTAMEALFSPEKNHGELRKQVAEIKPPCIPFLGMYLKDLLFTDDGIPSEINGLINFQKYLKIAQSLKEILYFQKFPYQDLQDNPSIKQTLLEEIQFYSSSSSLSPAAASSSPVPFLPLGVSLPMTHAGPDDWERETPVDRGRAQSVFVAPPMVQDGRNRSATLAFRPALRTRSGSFAAEPEVPSRPRPSAPAPSTKEKGPKTEKHVQSFSSLFSSLALSASFDGASPLEAAMTPGCSTCNSSPCRCNCNHSEFSSSQPSPSNSSVSVSNSSLESVSDAQSSDPISSPLSLSAPPAHSALPTPSSLPSPRIIVGSAPSYPVTTSTSAGIPISSSLSSPLLVTAPTVVPSSSPLVMAGPSLLGLLSSVSVASSSPSTASESNTDSPESSKFSLPRKKSTDSVREKLAKASSKVKSSRSVDSPGLSRTASRSGLPDRTASSSRTSRSKTSPPLPSTSSISSSGQAPINPTSSSSPTSPSSSPPPSKTRKSLGKISSPPFPIGFSSRSASSGSVTRKSSLEPLPEASPSTPNSSAQPSPTSSTSSLQKPDSLQRVNSLKLNAKSFSDSPPSSPSSANDGTEPTPTSASKRVRKERSLDKELERTERKERKEKKEKKEKERREKKGKTEKSSSRVEKSGSKEKVEKRDEPSEVK